MEFNILTERQAAFLQNFEKDKFLTKDFYLTGGTALAEFYLGHRLSGDLDFFSEEEFDLLALNVFLKKAKGVLGFTRVDFQKSNNRNLYFLHFDDEVLKIEFTFFPFPRIEKGEIKNGVQVDSFLDIAVNKLFTIYQRTQARDFVDLYFIFRKGDLVMEDLVSKARAKFDWHIDPLQLGTQFSKVTEAKDYPRMIMELPEGWQDFFTKEARKFKNSIIS